MASDSGSFVQAVYDAVLRPHLPRKLAVCNGVVTRRVRLLDRTDHMPDYEHTLLGAVRDHVAEGDHVTDIGGGFGVAAVVAARQAGESGSVLTYEASETHVELIREAAVLNGVADRVTVVPKLVGPAYDVWGDEVPEQVDPADLAETDVVVMDCEGAEKDIVPALGVTPRVLVVEVHEEAGASMAAISDHLRGHGYELDVRGETAGEVQGRILVAVREDAGAGP